MRNITVTTFLVLLLVPSSVWAACTGSSPTWTATPDYSSVSSCVSSASRGDTINVTAGDGTESWSNALSLTKGVHLQGPGRDNLTISRSNTLIIITPDATARSNNETIRVTGFTFNGNDAFVSAGLIDVNGSSSVAFKNLAIGDNRIRNITGSGTGIYCTGIIFGVVYNNIFTDVAIVWRELGGQSTAPYDNYPLVNGSEENLYFEDNTINFTKSNNWSGWTEGGQSGRYTMRFNTWNLSNVSDCGLWDMHGNQNGSDMGGEIYGNIITNKVFGCTSDQRGGKRIIFNNRFSGSGNSNLNVRYESDHPDWPGYLMHVNNSYYWNNWEESTRRDAGVSETYQGIPAANQDFWNYTPSFTGSTGIGAGSSNPTMNCTTGVGYWVTSYSPASTPPSTMADMKTYSQAGRLWRCESPGNNWQLYYTPYEYPHPLRFAILSAPRNLRITNP